MTKQIQIVKATQIKSGEVARALRVFLDNNKSLTVGFSSTTPDFMIQRTDGTVAVTTKHAVLKSMTGIVNPDHVKKLAQYMDALRPVVAGKSSIVAGSSLPVKSYKANCSCCGTGLSDKVIEFCNRKLQGQMICFTCQRTPGKPSTIEGASEASAPTPSEVSTSDTSTPSFTKKGKGDDSCSRCGGSGYIAAVKHVLGGACFKCNPVVQKGYAEKRGPAPSYTKRSTPVTTSPDVELVLAAEAAIEAEIQSEIQKMETDPNYFESISIVMSNTDVDCTIASDENLISNPEL